MPLTLFKSGGWVPAGLSSWLAPAGVTASRSPYPFLHHQTAHQPKGAATSGAAALGDRKPVALASRHPVR